MGKPVFEVHEPCQWLEVVHSCNLDNSTGLYRPFIPLDKEWMRQNFNVTVDGPAQTESIIIALSKELQRSQKKLYKVKSFWPIKIILSIKGLVKNLH